MTTETKEQKPQENSKPPVSQRFVEEVERQFAQEMGESLQFTDQQKRLAQHIYLKADEALEEFEQRRRSKGNDHKSPYTWNNVNLKSMALDAVHKVSLGLDAMMKNHIHAVPYWNSNSKKYDLELQTGFKGLKFIAKKYAIDPPKKIITELVHENDHFKPLKANFNREVESYEFEIENPFNRGPIQGGFGYIMYDDPEKNELVIVTADDFEKAKNNAPTSAIWNEWPEKMRYKTVVRRTVDRIDFDPEKANAQALLKEETGSAEKEAQREIEENANQKLIDVEPVVDESAKEDREPQPPEEQPAEMPQKDNAEEDEAEGGEHTPHEDQMAMTGTEGPDF